MKSNESVWGKTAVGGQLHPVPFPGYVTAFQHFDLGRFGHYRISEIVVDNVNELCDVRPCESST